MISTIRSLNSFFDLRHKSKSEMFFYISISIFHHKTKIEFCSRAVFLRNSIFHFRYKTRKDSKFETFTIRFAPASFYISFCDTKQNVESGYPKFLFRFTAQMEKSEFLSTFLHLVLRNKTKCRNWIAQIPFFRFTAQIEKSEFLSTFRFASRNEQWRAGSCTWFFDFHHKTKIEFNFRATELYFSTILFSTSKTTRIASSAL